STWSVVLVLDMMLLLAAVQGYGGRAPGCLVLAAPSAARESAATQQLQQQQQPATRHRSTARRLVSMSSRRVDTSDSLPNGHTIKPTAEPAPSAGHRLSEHLPRGIAVAPRRRR